MALAEEFFDGVGDVLGGELPGTSLSGAEILGGTLVIAGGIWLVRKAFNKALGKE